MNPFFILILFSAFFSTLLFSQEIFLDQNWENSKGIYSRTESYCHPTKEGDSFCQTDALSYPVFVDAPDQKIVKVIEDIVQKEIIRFNKGNLQKTVLQNLDEEVYQSGGTWDTKNALNLFTVTATTFTMVTDGSGYTGGAHGYFSTHYTNYSHDGSILKLDTLLKDDYNATLHTIAEQVYRKKVGLGTKESLEKDGWFTNEFVLTPNFAITDRGLLFQYNSYEIKPYAAGQTEFMLPYGEIRALIDPSGPLRLYLQTPKKMQRTFYIEDLAKLSLLVKRISATQVRIVADETRLTYAKQSWLSLSFPDLKSKKDVKIASSKGFTSTHIYPRGSKIYHHTMKKAVKSQYLLVEGETLKEEENEAKQMTVLVTVPRGIKTLNIRLRASFKNGKVLKMMPMDLNSVKGQQGFYNYPLVFPLP